MLDGPWDFAGFFFLSQVAYSVYYMVQTCLSLCLKRCHVLRFQVRAFAERIYPLRHAAMINW
jgi:hypothetical protein